MDEKSDFPSPITTMHAPTLTTTTLPTTNTIATTPMPVTTPTPITIPTPTTIITTTTSTTKITEKDGWEDFIAGSFAGMAQVTVGQPLDTIKVRLQLNSTKFKGPMDCLVQTIKNEGFFALYKGMASPLVGAGAVNALLFTIYSRLKELQMTTVDQQLSIHQIAIAGAGAGALNSFLASPVELLKIRMQAQYGNPLAKHSTAANNSVMYKGPIDCARQLIREHGIRNGLFRGFWVTVAREIPAYGGFYAGFEFMKRKLTPAGTSPDDLSPGRLMLSGSTGGVCYWLCSYPLDVIKSKVQNQQAPPKGGIFYIFTTTKSIYRTEGLKAFTRGITPTLLRSLPSAASTFTVYELSMRLLTKIKQ